MKINCIIIEDEPKARLLIEEYVAEINYLCLINSFSGAQGVFDVLESKKIDLVFLDIHLPIVTGLELASLLAPHTKVIFITAHSEHAVTSYDLSAVDYLLKPVTFERFERAVEKARIIIEGEKHSDSFYIKSGKKWIQLQWSEVNYIKGMKEYVSFVTDNGQYLVYKRMAEIESLMPEHFLRVHNSWIVNMEIIINMEGNTLYTKNKKIPVSRKYEKELRVIIANRLIN